MNATLVVFPAASYVPHRAYAKSIASSRLLLLRSTCVYSLRFTDTTIIRYVTKRPDTYRRLTSNIEGTRRGKEKTKANRDMKIWATI